jgi:hypothetical protein
MAIDALIERRHRYIFGYKLVERLGDSSVSSIRDNNKYKRYTDAIEILEKEVLRGAK